MAFFYVPVLPGGLGQKEKDRRAGVVTPARLEYARERREEERGETAGVILFLLPLERHEYVNELGAPARLLHIIDLSATAVSQSGFRNLVV